MILLDIGWCCLDDACRPQPMSPRLILTRHNWYVQALVVVVFIGWCRFVDVWKTKSMFLRWCAQTIVEDTHTMCIRQIWFLKAFSDVEFHWTKSLARCAHATFVTASFVWCSTPLANISCEINKFLLCSRKPWRKLHIIGNVPCKMYTCYNTRV